MEDELRLLKDYLNVYIQLLPTYISRRQEHRRLTFEDYKQSIGKKPYDMSVPHFKESFDMNGDRVVRVHTHGMGSVDGIGTRYYNVHNSIKYYTDGNIVGGFNVSDDNLSNLKKGLYNLTKR